MNIKFAVISNNISGDDFITLYDGSLLRHFQQNGIVVEDVKLVDLVGIGKMPTCLADWADYDKVIIIGNSATAVFFLDVQEIIKNAELWVINWPKKISGSDRPDRHKFFNTMPQMSLEAKQLIAA